jgi:hypothetical protein
MAYITARNTIVDMRPYSISLVALNAISMRDRNLKLLLSNRDLRFCGIAIALPENRPWYNMMRVKKIG